MAITDQGFKIIAKPNNSMSFEQGVWLLGALTLLSLTIALGFAHMGAWMVLPFAGLELLAFTIAFYYTFLHAGDFDSISIEADQVVVEKKSSKITSRAVFQRYWTQINLRELENGGNALFIGSHGKEVEFGKYFMDDEQRILLARELKQKLKNYD